ELVVAVKMWQISDAREEPARRAVRITSDLNLDWEAWGWQSLLKSKGPLVTPPPPPLPTLTRSHQDENAVESVLEALRAARQRGSQLASADCDFSKYPVPKADTSTDNVLLKGDSATAPTLICFENSAPELGMDFEYRNGSRPNTKGEFMYESTGGGVAV